MMFAAVAIISYAKNPPNCFSNCDDYQVNFRKQPKVAFKYCVSMFSKNSGPPPLSKQNKHGLRPPNPLKMHM